MVTIPQAIEDLNKGELVIVDEDGKINDNAHLCTTEGELIILLRKLQFYEVLEKQGLIRVPKIGDDIWYIGKYLPRAVRGCFAGFVEDAEDLSTRLCIDYDGVDEDELPLSECGETWFLSQSAAHAALVARALEK